MWVDINFVIILKNLFYRIGERKCGLLRVCIGYTVQKEN